MYKPLVKVHLWSGLRSLADGAEAVEVRAATIGQMLDALVAAHPGLADAVEAGVSVSVDGKIYAQNLTEPVAEDSEVYLLQRIKGG
ncbi:MAG: MoaD/ThiS family protein [Rhodobacter sp.]|nr:MoaD/ThiS family protein [Rhodobacter sp.]